MQSSARIAVFTGNLSFSVRKGIVEIDRAIAGLSWLIVHHSQPRTPGKLLRSQLRNLQRNGWRWILYQVADMLARIFPSPGPTLSHGSPGHEYTLSSLHGRTNIRILNVADIHSDSTLEAVRAFAPSLGLSLAAPILRESLYSIPKLGTLNLHKGKLPEYRGMPPAFWELWNGADSVGCTVHRVDAKLDTGDIVAETTVRRQPFSTLRGLQLCLDEKGVELTVKAVESVLAGVARFTPQAPGGRTYRKPTLSQVAALEKRSGANALPRGTESKRLLKDAYFSTGIAAWRMGLRRLSTPRITVLLFHRVSDDVHDNLTVGIEQFDRQMHLLLKYFDVLTIPEVASMGPIRNSGRPKVCVTFDDGYLDNYENAVPILLRHGIPAAFFVATGVVGTNKQFPHDRRRGNAALPMMNWDQLRRMRDHGFTIGSHSVSHVDCAAEPEHVVKLELSASLADLMRELRLKYAIFAYPYGGKEHMTPERLELVKQAGYVACLSAYGAINLTRVDRYNVLRTGIHWEFSDTAFLHRCYGIGPHRTQELLSGMPVD